jgi:hypothetical protein
MSPSFKLLVLFAFLICKDCVKMNVIERDITDCILQLLISPAMDFCEACNLRVSRKAGVGFSEEFLLH